MSIIKNTFTIGEIEDLTGIKAHTIRIWEKRYQILEPLRKESKSRMYTNSDLKKLLNISVLIKSGHKISKIALYSETQIEDLILKSEISSLDTDSIMYQLRLSMATYNEQIFLKIYKQLRLAKSLREVFETFILPLLEQTGILWQTNQILPTHEHFISNIVRMILISEVYKLDHEETKCPIFVLFTPVNEIHEIALLFLQYEIILKGFKCIYLGTHVPSDSLKAIEKQYSNLIFLAYSTIDSSTTIEKYVLDLARDLNLDNNQLWIAGKNLNNDFKINDKQITIFNSVIPILEKLEVII